MNAAAPLPVQSRDSFLREVAAKLESCPALGDGVVALTCREAQRKYFDPPNLSNGGGVPKYR